jgi:outer membrane lipoprotein-sorting protein
MKRSSILGMWILACAVVVGVHADSKVKSQAQPGSTAPAQQTAAPDPQKKAEASPCKTVGETAPAAGVHAQDAKSKAQQATAVPAQQTATMKSQEADASPCKSVEGTAQHTDPLEKVLRGMDENAAKFSTAQADFIWTPYNSVINETETPDRGKIYFRRAGKEIQMAAELQPPDGRQIVFADGKVQVYQPRTKVLDIYDAGAHREEVESFLVLGFGSSGEDLRKSFDVKYMGEEKIGNVQTAKLELVPLAEKIKRSFPRIDLWIDPQRGLSLRQELFQQGGDYRLADYSNIRLHGKVPDSAFKLKTSGQTKTVTH